MRKLLIKEPLFTELTHIILGKDLRVEYLTHIMYKPFNSQSTIIHKIIPQIFRLKFK